MLGLLVATFSSFRSSLCDVLEFTILLERFAHFANFRITRFLSFLTAPTWELFQISSAAIDTRLIEGAVLVQYLLILSVIHEARIPLLDSLDMLVFIWCTKRCRVIRTIPSFLSTCLLALEYKLYTREMYLINVTGRYLWTLHTYKQ